MSELMHRVTSLPDDLKTGRALTRLTNQTRLAQAEAYAATRVEHAAIQAISMVGEVGMSEVAYLKAVQRRAEHANVDAAEAIALVVDQAVINIARRVARFGQRADW